MDATAIGIGVLIAVLLLIALGVVFTVSRLFRKVEQGQALIISRTKHVDVTFTGAVVLPILHNAEQMDISVKTIEIKRTGREGLICQDNIRADIHLTFFVRVNKTTEDVIKVAQAIGTARASHQETLQALFAAKFSEALKTVGKQLDFVDLYTQRDHFRDQIIQVIGTDLNGYHLEDAAIDFLEQTPMTQLDAANILDAQGIRKITELTAIEHVRTNEFQRTEQKEITRQNVEARETILELERRQAEAEIKQRREVETLRAKEESSTMRVQEEERLGSQGAFIRTEELLGIQRENQGREIAVAQKNRERVIAVENERIEKDRLLEVIARERETELSRISKDKEVEAERREVADVIRERIAVDRTVAEQEESIKALRLVQEAERERQALIVRAEGQAQEKLVKDIKAAEAAEQSATHRAREALTMAESRKQASELDAQAKIRLAEGMRAEAAAAGLAEVEVRERSAEAIEKVGLAEAAVAREKNTVEAEGIGRRLKEEAAGLTDKAAAMAALDDASRGHEEYRLRLAAEKDIRLASLDMQRQVAEAQATVLATGLESATISIVGGESVFFDRVVGAMSLGKSVDAFVDSSDAVKALAGPWLDGSSRFTEDATRVLGSLGSGGVQNLTVSALLMRLIASGGPQSGGLQQLLDQANSLGLGQLPLDALGSAAPAAGPAAAPPAVNGAKPAAARN
ncbi:flotillin family protein [Streptomyces sp. SID13666]|uniref:SPFH domain-containing protein n=1 Tax=Streptomyces TaxID=1883 RepID=UPI001106552D|nr:MULTISPECIES: SPFH domain-containing protein [Streptomyces]MCZ4102893.1 SPFH domain-containing protein [Streptomyces sp. H39-C1]NEA55731.1 flotillin family protein [Streptomyces sp. SID13666]NEA73184.1 flotillin family protein [Streptomyces sp. SID13588]QNA74039.1 flotillin family protein [Streptomyces sp. So13.3]